LTECSAQAFSGGHVDSATGTIISPGVGKEIPVPVGEYLLTANPWDIPKHPTWYGVLRRDNLINDYADDVSPPRSGFRLHPGETSWGCITLNEYNPDSVAMWNSIVNMISKTAPTLLTIVNGPHFYDQTKTINQYGVITVK
jgi:hypothetical protein